ncbi:dienelactone hydrolase family protein [Streptomyces sp. NBC_01619]|uniref:Dienelactone hydrolase family protein n=1 Tax=Streptomyces pratisoli TaxID=3139917 RepID=A0ACC6QGZ3_9ACTN|nr:dienelactone hydrolase family protein [Streptomyces sp. NBC_01619]MCX4509222.1 dienelactone hydrolase family protein [Streptomyces sp. NBC_01619]
MTYDPFTRGAHPVGVRSDLWTDTERQRTLPVEIWYPAHDHHRGHDLDPEHWDTFSPGWVAEGQANPADVVPQTAVRNADWADPSAEHPLILLIHGYAGFRREATFLGTHLASHGYVVVSPDVVGSTFLDVNAFLTAEEPSLTSPAEHDGEPDDDNDHLLTIAQNRKKDIPFLIDTATATLPVRPHGVGVTGASFGGWSSIVAPAVDDRVTAVVPMCPAGGDSPVADPDNGFVTELALDWHNDAPTLVLAADRDSLLPLYGQLALFRSLPATRKRMVVLARADHNHFVDDIDTGQAWLKEFAEQLAALFPDGPGDWPRVARSVEPMERLVPGDKAKLAWQGMVTAHFDAHLSDDPGAKAFVSTDPDAVLAARGIDTYTIEFGSPSSAVTTHRAR